jgi:SAM-dependent methyltransferase
LVDTYKEPETTLQATNDYRRNYVLFEKILQRSVDSFEAEFLLCSRCGLIFFSPRPDEADLKIKYQLVAAEGDTLAREKLRELVDLRSMRAEAIRRRLEPFWTRKAGWAVDVGGADGHCLAGLTADFECGVVDYEERRCWPGVKKLANTLEELPSDRQFDIILCCHTLEHIPDITDFVKHLAERLMEGGILYVEVPYGCAGEIYETRNCLTHLNFFSEGSLGFLLEQEVLHVIRLESGPVLSKNSYLPVIWGIARKDSEHPPAGSFLREGASITRDQLKRPLNWSVFLANVRLVLSQPVAYGLAYARYVQRHLSR